MITGGTDITLQVPGLKPLSYDLTEVIDLSTRTTRITSTLNIPRQNHGMSIMKIAEEFKLVAFGGEHEQCLLDSVEIWNTHSETWEILKTHRLRLKRSRFSAVTVFNGLSSNSHVAKTPDPSSGT